MIVLEYWVDKILFILILMLGKEVIILKKKHKLMMAAISAGILGGILAACGTKKSAAEDSGFEEILPSSIESSESEKQGTELIAVAENEEQAQEIADLYQIELLSFSDRVAVYTTDKDPHELIALGKQNGYPLLSISYTLQLY